GAARPRWPGRRRGRRWGRGGLRAGCLSTCRGYDPDPADSMTPGQVYASLLRALGVPGDEVPVTEAEQATAFTSHGPVAGRAGAVAGVVGQGRHRQPGDPAAPADTAIAGHPRRTHRPVPGG